MTEPEPEGGTVNEAWRIPNVCPMSGLGIIDNEGELDRVQICHCTCGAYVDVVSGRVTPHSRGVDTLSEEPTDD